MSNLKDTDKDDLFRRASDKYPLRTDSADWDKMAAALDEDPTPAGFDGTTADDRRRKRRFFMLLLLLPLGGVGYYTWNHAGHGAGHPSLAVVSGQANRKGSGEKAANVRGTTQANVQGTTGQANVRGTTQANVQGTTGQANVRGTAQANVRETGQVNGSAAKGVDGKAVGDRSGSGNVKGGRRFAGALVEEKNATAGDIGKAGSITQRYITAQPFTMEWAGDVQRARIAGDYRLSVEVTAPPAAKNTEPAKPKKQKTSYLYAGILGAPDISTVKMQSVKGVGTTFGILVGYAFNPRWSIETGVYLDRKKYYTEGEYFDKEHLPSYIDTLENANGTCYMLEIPLNVRYTFNPEGKTKWFVTGGLSTYLMTKESYNYAYEHTYYGRPWYGQSNLNNKKPSQYPFSIVNLSAGFEQKLGKVGSLRVEPYLRMPLEGIGTGKLPIMSAGVNIGITRRLW